MAPRIGVIWLAWTGVRRFHRRSGGAARLITPREYLLDFGRQSKSGRRRIVLAAMPMKRFYQSHKFIFGIAVQGATMSGTDENDPYDLQRFLDAQSFVFEQVRAELRAGQKRGHWI